MGLMGIAGTVLKVGAGVGKSVLSLGKGALGLVKGIFSNKLTKGLVLGGGALAAVSAVTNSSAKASDGTSKTVSANPKADGLLGTLKATVQNVFSGAAQGLKSIGSKLGDFFGTGKSQDLSAQVSSQDPSGPSGSQTAAALAGKSAPDPEYGNDPQYGE